MLEYELTSVPILLDVILCDPNTHLQLFDAKQKCRHPVVKSLNIEQLYPQLNFVIIRSNKIHFLTIATEVSG